MSVTPCSLAIDTRTEKLAQHLNLLRAAQSLEEFSNNPRSISTPENAQRIQEQSRLLAQEAANAENPRDIILQINEALDFKGGLLALAGYLGALIIDRSESPNLNETTRKALAEASSNLNQVYDTCLQHAPGTALITQEGF